MLTSSAALSSSASSASGFGGFSPYLASYSAANSASFSGWQMKHCDSGRLCFSHQSPFALKSATSLVSHWAQTSSGTPCSLHHQPSCVWPAIATLSSAGVAAARLLGRLAARRKRQAQRSAIAAPANNFANRHISTPFKQNPNTNSTFRIDYEPFPLVLAQFSNAAYLQLQLPACFAPAT